MTRISDIKIPTFPKIFPKKPHDFPITERENLMRVLNHEKPAWMPNIFESSQEAPNVGIGEMPDFGSGRDYTDMFGVEYRFSAAQGSATPINKVMSDVTRWKEEVVWPDLSLLDTAPAAAGFVRDENLALQTRLFSACFEHLHFLEGFEQALIDLVTEPAACREFFEASVDFYIEMFDIKYAAFKYDWLFYNDDWGTAHGPFFSEKTLRETILAPTKRYIAHIRSKGVKVVFHNCGLIDRFVPILVGEVGADGLDIQPINDIKGILTNFGADISPTLQSPDPYFFYDPETTLGAVRDKARYYVDCYGAHANPGAGVMLMFAAPTEDIYNAFMDEVYAYSLKRYAGG